MVAIEYLMPILILNKALMLFYNECGLIIISFDSVIY